MELSSKLRRAYIAFITIIIFSQPCMAKELWKFKLTSETPRLVESPFFLITAVDLNQNGYKEIIAADFGRLGDHMGELQREKHEKAWLAGKGHIYNLFVLEWEKKELKLKFSKQWDTTGMSDIEADKYFYGRNAQQMVAWQIGNKVIAETIPPYLGLEWDKGKYLLNEQQGWAQKTPLIGSWTLPWISPSCYQGFPNKMTWPRECIVGIRDFSGKGQHRVLTILEDGQSGKQTLRVRKFEPGFPVEWEAVSPKRFNWWTPPIVDPIDRLNKKAISGLLLTAFQETSWYVFEQEKDNSYRIKGMPVEGSMSIDHYDLPDIYLRSTQKKGVEEYWGYRRIEQSDPESLSFILKLRQVTLKTDLSGFVKKDIDFPYHKNFVGVGFFAVEDMDDDGLDEIILVEETAGKFEPYGETIRFLDIKDYIRILKWNGKEYQTMWVSPPYTKRGTKFLVEDIKNTGKKQLVVLSPYGTVQIWEKQ